MKAFPIDSTKHEYYGRTCVDEDCGKPMRVGDVALVEAKQDRFAVVDRELFWHRRCVEKALRFAPAESNEVTAAVDRIRESIAATGHGPVGWALEDDEDEPPLVDGEEHEVVVDWRALNREQAGGE